MQAPEANAEGPDNVLLNVSEKYLKCQICMGTMADPMATVCGHTFCSGCISMHLQHRSSCPECGNYLTPHQTHPNFLLQNLLKQAAKEELQKALSPFERVRGTLRSEADWKVGDLTSLIKEASKKRQEVQHKGEATNLQLLQHFLAFSREEKLRRIKELHSELASLDHDLAAACAQHARAHETCLGLAPPPAEPPPAHESIMPMPRIPMPGAESMLAHAPQPHNAAQDSETGAHVAAAHRGPIADLELTARGKKRRMMDTAFAALEANYLAMHRAARPPPAAGPAASCESTLASTSAFGKGLKSKGDPAKPTPPPQTASRPHVDGPNGRLPAFSKLLRAVTRYSCMHEVTRIGPGKQARGASRILSSIEFSCDGLNVATAGVSQSVSIYDYDALAQGRATEPSTTLTSRSKLSCLSWSKALPSQLISSDYEGVITLWDVNAGHALQDLEAHEKRIWSIDFNTAQPAIFASGSDDGRVKVWHTGQPRSGLTIDLGLSVCSVHYAPAAGHLLAVGSAGQAALVYDLRAPREPLHAFSNHGKAVSYVKFLSGEELVSLSTDSALRVWDLRDNVLAATCRGHTNEKNFVGLSVEGAYIACGSETNEVYVYHKSIQRPIVSHAFAAPPPSGAHGRPFVSTVCWRPHSSCLVAANSQGTVQVLAMS